MWIQNRYFQEPFWDAIFNSTVYQIDDALLEIVLQSISNWMADRFVRKTIIFAVAILGAKIEALIEPWSNDHLVYNLGPEKMSDLVVNLRKSIICVSANYCGQRNINRLRY